jgi:TonB family protein
MNRLIAATLLVLFGLVHSSPSCAQQEPADSGRKVVSRVIPNYPEMARTLNIKGIVRAEALVKPNGTVRVVDVKGGHPLLAQAARDAIYKWKWEPTAHETHEPIEVRFDPK